MNQFGRAHTTRTRVDPEETNDTLLELSLIIPAHNEEARVGATIERYAAAVQPLYGDRFEILVVSNGSTDRTCEIVLAAHQKHPELQLVDIPLPIGKGGAVLEGFRRARGRRFAFTDADGATAPESVLALAGALDDHDVVIGSRRMPASVISQRQPLTRRVFSRAFTWFAHVLFGLPYADTQCGAKAFRRDVATRLADLIFETQWTFDLDLLLACRTLGVDVWEEPVTWADQPGSRLRFGPTIACVVPSLWRLACRYAGVPNAGTVQPAREPITSTDGCYEPTFAHSRL